MAFSSGTVFAQNEKARSILTGKYQGTAKSAGKELTITLELVDNGGTFSGSVTTQHGTFKIVKTLGVIDPKERMQGTRQTNKLGVDGVLVDVSASEKG